jgi:hypothetical protein
MRRCFGPSSLRSGQHPLCTTTSSSTSSCTAYELIVSGANAYYFVTGSGPAVYCYNDACLVARAQLKQCVPQHCYDWDSLQLRTCARCLQNNQPNRALRSLRLHVLSALTQAGQGDSVLEQRLSQCWAPHRVGAPFLHNHLLQRGHVCHAHDHLPEVVRPSFQDLAIKATANNVATRAIKS